MTSTALAKKKSIKAIARIQRLQESNKAILLNYPSLTILIEYRKLFRRHKSELYRKAFNDYKKYMRNKKIIDDNEELYNKVCDSVAHINIANIQSVGEDIQNNIYNEDEDNAGENKILQSIEIRHEEEPASLLIDNTDERKKTKLLQYPP